MAASNVDQLNGVFGVEWVLKENMFGSVFGGKEPHRISKLLSAGRLLLPFYEWWVFVTLSKRIGLIVR